MKLKIVLLAFIAVLVYSCSPKVVPPVSQPTLPSKTPSTELAEGKNLYDNNCAKCHRLYDRREYNVQEWGPILISMQDKAGITDAEREKIYNYLIMN